MSRVHFLYSVNTSEAGDERYLAALHKQEIARARAETMKLPHDLEHNDPYQDLVVSVPDDRGIEYADLLEPGTYIVQCENTLQASAYSRLCSGADTDVCLPEEPYAWEQPKP